MYAQGVVCARKYFWESLVYDTVVHGQTYIRLWAKESTNLWNWTIIWSNFVFTLIPLGKLTFWPKLFAQWITRTTLPTFFLLNWQYFECKGVSQPHPFPVYNLGMRGSVCVCVSKPEIGETTLFVSRFCFLRVGSRHSARTEYQLDYRTR